MNEMFCGVKNLKSLDVSGFDTSSVNSMSYLFSGMYSLTSLDITNFNTSIVTSMNRIFSYLYSLQSLDISNFYSPKTYNMRCMFQWSKFDTLNVKGLNTTLVKDMTGMFVRVNASFLDLSTFNTKSVVTMN